MKNGYQRYRELIMSRMARKRECCLIVTMAPPSVEDITLWCYESMKASVGKSWIVAKDALIEHIDGFPMPETDARIGIPRAYFKRIELCGRRAIL